MKKIAIVVESSRAYGRAIIEGIAAYAQKTGEWTLNLLSDDEATEEELRLHDGVIARIANEVHARRFTRAKIPVVDVFCNHTRPGFGMVDADHAEIGRKAANFFRSRGFTNFAFFGIPGATFSDDRAKAFAAACPNKPFIYGNGLEFPFAKDLIFRERADRIGDAATIRKWVRKLPKPIAVFCCSDVRAFQLQRIVISCGFDVPKDFVLLGVDNDTMICSFAKVPISSIDPNAFRIGHNAARMLDVMIKKAPMQKPHGIHRIHCGEIVERTSSEYLPVDPPWLGKVMLHIEKNMSSPVSASEIFALAERAPASVEKAFKEHFGVPVQTYVNIVKLTEAKRLLLETDLRISEIAYQCGYTTPQYFCRLFGNYYHTTPKDLRKGHRTC